MATIVGPAPRAAGRDRFFLILSLAMSATIVAGFAFNLAMGRSSFSLPLIYHVHAFVFFGWIALFLIQNFLIATENVRIHRRVGVIALGWVPLMVVMGFAVMLHSLRSHGGPPFFDAREFLFGNPMDLLCFAGLVFAALAMRRHSDWHRRLMLCAVTILTGPGLGRLLPLPLMIPWSWTVASLLAPLIFPLIGIVADLIRMRRVHPAWLWGVAAIVGTNLLAEAIAYTPFGTSVTRAVVAGSPGADRPLAAHWP
ncbi:MAG TPA: hypothetical protein VM662_11025 [Sphingomonas sp.]|nr:hypothetical protein [Sphingomonas sp.]